MPNFTQLKIKSNAIFRLTLPVRALSTSVSLPKSSGTCSWSVSVTGSIFCRLVLVVSPLENMEKPKVSFIKNNAWNARQLYERSHVYFTYPMSCSCDRSLENGMKSTMLRRALDLLEPATRKEHVNCQVIINF